MANSANVKEVTDQNFETEIQSGVSLVDFWAEWCGPCRMLAPTIDSVADEYAGKMRVLKMNVDDNPTTPQKFQIRSIPTLIIFKDGKPVESLIGNLPKNHIVDSVKKHL